MKTKSQKGLHRCWPGSRAVPGTHVFLMGLLACARVQAAVPEPMAGSFRYDYPEVLPPRAGATSESRWLGLLGTASTGDGGWLALWHERTTGYSARLRVRLLPPGFDTEPVGADGYWEGGPPAFTLSPGALYPPALGAVAASTDGSGVVVWVVDGWVQAQRAEQATGGVSGPVLRLASYGASYGPYAILAVTEGTGTWVSYSYASGAYGALLEKDGPGLRPKAWFSVPGLLFPLATAARGELLLTVANLPPWQSPGVRAAVVKADGTTTPTVTLDLPAGAAWLGALPDAEGYLGYWTQDPGESLPLLLYSRSLTARGEWRPGSTEAVVSGLARSANGWRLTPGPVLGILDASGGVAYSLKPGALPRLLGTAGESASARHASDPAGRVLTVNVTGSEFLQNQALIARRVDLSGLQPARYVALTPGTGRQQAPALAWTPRGPQVVFQVDGYFPMVNGVAGAVGFNKLAAAPAGTGLPVPDAAFSTAAQAWQGDSVQLVAYRRVNPVLPESNDSDDVAGQLYTRDAAGVLSASGAPFLIGSGAGSQRGVSLAAYNDGFLAAWREEKQDPADATGIYTIRAATISRTGQVAPPGGRLLAIDLQELSAVDVAANGYITWRAAEPFGNAYATVIRGASYGSYIFPLTLSPPSHNARAPKAIALGGGTLVVWRNQFTHSIQSVIAGQGTGAVRQISPPGPRAREPVVAPLGPGTVAVLWLEEQGYFPGVWLAVVDASGVSRAVPAVTGNFDRDTLAAAGDGAGRLAVAVLDKGLDAPGIKVVQLTPLVPADAGLDITAGAAGVTLSWQVSDVFPARLSIVESSRDLRQWLPAAAAASPSLHQGRAALWFPLTPGEGYRHFRLRGAVNTAAE